MRFVLVTLDRWAIVVLWATCLKMGDKFASFQIWGNFPESRDFGKITCGQGQVLHGEFVELWSWTGLCRLLCGVQGFNQLTESCISRIWLYGLEWKGKSRPWSFNSRSFRWAKALERSGNLGLKTDWDCLFRAFDFSQSSQRVLPSDFSGATPFEYCFECLSSDYSLSVITRKGHAQARIRHKLRCHWKRTQVSCFKPYIWPGGHIWAATRHN